MDPSILEQLNKIGMSPSANGLDETYFQDQSNQIPSPYEMLDQHIEGMQEMVSTLDSSGLLYLISGIISLYNQK